MLVRRQPFGWENLFKGGGEIKLPPVRQDRHGQGRGQGLVKEARSKIVFRVTAAAPGVLGQKACGPLPPELSTKPHQGHRRGKDALADAGFQELLQGSPSSPERGSLGGCGMMVGAPGAPFISYLFVLQIYRGPPCFSAGQLTADS